MNDREKSMELLISQQVVNAEFYNSVCLHTPLLSKLMMDKFKVFLEDTYFTDLERQTLLMLFFERQTNIDIVNDIINYVQTCKCKDDYTKIILEWSYNNSDKIIKSNLAKFDGAGLYGNKQKHTRLIKPLDFTEEVMNGLIQMNFLPNNNNEEE